MLNTIKSYWKFYQNWHYNSNNAYLKSQYFVNFNICYFMYQNEVFCIDSNDVKFVVLWHNLKKKHITCGKHNFNSFMEALLLVVFTVQFRCKWFQLLKWGNVRVFDKAIILFCHIHEVFQLFSFLHTFGFRIFVSH